jgi:hypothetical protein
MNIFGRASPPKWSAQFCGCGENAGTCKFNQYMYLEKISFHYFANL